MPLGRDNYLSTLEFLKGVSKSTEAVCLSGDFHSTTSWRWFVYYLRWICSSLHLQRITAVIKLQGQGKGRQAGRQGERGEGRGESPLLSRLSYSGALPCRDVWYSNPSETRQVVINQQVWSEVNIHHHLYRHRCYQDDHFSTACLLYGCTQRQRQDEWEKTTCDKRS